MDMLEIRMCHDDRAARRRRSVRFGAASSLSLGIALATLVVLPSVAQTVDEPASAQSRKPLAPDFSADIEARKRYGVAALEIVGFDVLLNQANRRWSGVSDYDSNLSTIRRNLRSGWVSITTRSTSTSSPIRTRARSITRSRGRRA